MNNSYNPHEVEEEAQSYWAKKQSFNVTEDLNKEKFYCLAMFPYPSGSLHMGHVRNYTLSDVIARYQRAQGKNVLQPIGWDAFGLPAENAAILNGIHPAVWTQKNIAAMKEQFLRLGNAYDWRREISTCNPDYYRWEQWFFIKLFNKGLVYKKNASVNWDPVDQTVLANEQVIDGKGWRSGAAIERKDISQWFVKITAYADELLLGLNNLDEWPSQVKQMQRNWIGRSQGCEIFFDIQSPKKRLKIYTTRPETLMGVTYLALAPDHPFVLQLAQTNRLIDAFIQSCAIATTTEALLSTQEKRGIATGLLAIHPVTGAELPVWVANFVLMQYGTGAVMSVPAHDQRDFEFAQRYNLPIQCVIQPNEMPVDSPLNAAITEPGVLINSAQFNGLHSTQAQSTVIEHLENLDLGRAKVHYRLRDWGISRQRYWGTPIPMISCEQCGTVPVPEDELPVVLPSDVNFAVSGSPLAQCPEFMNTICPKCGQDATRESDTFDTFMESSWYYARFACQDQDNAMLDDRAKYWTPVNQYVGGVEHAVMHLLYARFFHKLMRDEGLVNSDEPFKRLLTQGMLLKNGHKMSKSVGNVVDPNRLIEQYGADTARLFVLFAAPPEQSLEWSDAGVEGAHRFLKRLWLFVHQHQALMLEMNDIFGEELPKVECHANNTKLKKSRLTTNQILAQANHDYERQQFNTVISAAMKLLNELSSFTIEMDEDRYFIYTGISVLLRILAPITPHITHVLWQHCGFSLPIIDAHWPKVDKHALKSNDVDFIVQVNGKMRGQFSASTDMPENDLIERACLEVSTFLVDKTIAKTIIVPHRQLINLVVNA